MKLRIESQPRCDVVCYSGTHGCSDNDHEQDRRVLEHLADRVGASRGRFLVPIPLVVLAAVWALGGLSQFPLQDGDIIFQTSRSSQSLAVQRATHSRYSHMGVVIYRAGRPYVIEAVSTVRYSPVFDWVARGQGGHFVVKRLVDSERLLTPRALRRLRSAASEFQGRPYDPLFGWSNETIYCSELVWKLYMRLGIRLSAPRTVGDFDLTDPIVKRKAKERYPAGIPLGEPAVAPSDIFDSPLLKTVHSR